MWLLLVRVGWRGGKWLRQSDNQVPESPQLHFYQVKGIKIEPANFVTETPKVYGRLSDKVSFDVERRGDRENRWIDGLVEI